MAGRAIRKIIASDLPLQGANRPQTTQMSNAIRYLLKTKWHWKAGKYKIGYQSCDDSTAQAGKWDAAKCTSNASAYAADKTVIGVVGTFNSGCAKLEIPIVNRARPGPLGMVSPSNTAVGLTVSGLGANPGEPDIYYPTGKRNYARVVWTTASRALRTRAVRERRSRPRRSTSSPTRRRTASASRPCS